MQTACRVLKLKPKAVYKLAVSGVLPSREQGRKTLFYEEGVIKYYATQPAWKAAVAEPKSKYLTLEADDSILMNNPTEERQRIDIHTASKILGRSIGAVYQQIAYSDLPHYKEGRKIHFYTDELLEWAKNHPPLKRKAK